MSFNDQREIHILLTFKTSGHQATNELPLHFSYTNSVLVFTNTTTSNRDKGRADESITDIYQCAEDCNYLGYFSRE